MCCLVQLAHQTEVFVAPKRRRRTENSVVKALLRIQDEDDRFFHKCRVNETEMVVLLTSAIFIHSETAKMFSLDYLQPVVLEQKLVIKERKLNHETYSPSKNGKSTPKEVDNGTPTDKKDIRQAVVRLLISDSVAKGHVMLSRSLRYYLRAGLHSCKFIFIACNFILLILLNSQLPLYYLISVSTFLSFILPKKILFIFYRYIF